MDRATTILWEKKRLRLRDVNSSLSKTATGNEYYLDRSEGRGVIPLP
jgi:hypothetical protein